jgi:hypothetical protein
MLSTGLVFELNAVLSEEVAAAVREPLGRAFSFYYIYY